MKKKTAVVAAAAVGAVAVGGAAFAYIAIGGSGTGAASASADTTTPIGFTAAASISELDTPANVTVTGTSPKANRHIGSLSVALGTLPVGCEKSWFTLTDGTTTVTGDNPFTTNFGAAGYTFADTTPTAVPANLTITLDNKPVAQNACLGVNSLPLTVSASA